MEPDQTSNDAIPSGASSPLLDVVNDDQTGLEPPLKRTKVEEAEPAAPAPGTTVEAEAPEPEKPAHDPPAPPQDDPMDVSNPSAEIEAQPPQQQEAQSVTAATGNEEASKENASGSKMDVASDSIPQIPEIKSEAAPVDISAPAATGDVNVDVDAMDVDPPKHEMPETVDPVAQEPKSPEQRQTPLPPTSPSLSNNAEFSKIMKPKTQLDSELRKKYDRLWIETKLYVLNKHFLTKKIVPKDPASMRQDVVSGSSFVALSQPPEDYFLGCDEYEEQQAV